MHTTYLLKRYICVAALTMIGLAVMAFALEYLAGVGVGSALGIVSAIVPAMDAGQTYAKRWEARPMNGYGWQISFAFVVLNFLTGLVLLAALLSVTGELGVFADLIDSLSSAMLLGILAVVFIVYWCASRYFFGYGAKLALRAIENGPGTNQP